MTLAVKPEIVSTWLKRGISEAPLLLHGTSIDAVCHLVKHGVLPVSRMIDFYFTPITIFFRRSPYCSPLRLQESYTKSQAMRTSKFYAEENSHLEFLKNSLGFLPDWYGNEVHQKRNLNYWLQDDKKIHLSKLQIKELVDKMFERKGVIIEPTYSVFNLKYHQGDDKCSVAVTCPGGFPAPFIRGILPLGKLEKKIIRGFLK